MKPGVVFISGGMSGIGRGLVGAYLQCGADVAVFDLVCDGSPPQDMEKQKGTARQKILTISVDVTDFEALDAAIGRATAELGPPQLAINSAGVQRALPFPRLSREDFENVVRVNMFGSRNFAAALLPRMEPGSRLALIASMAGFTANYSYAAYSASKFGVVGLGKVLRLEYKPRGLHVSLICPPEVDTPMVVAERLEMHPVSRQLKAMAGTLSVDEAVRAIVAGLDAGRDVIIPGKKAKMTYLLGRYLPDVLLNLVVDRIVRAGLGANDSDKQRADQ